MKKLGLLALAFIFSAAYWSQSVMISQYIETSSGTTPKGIEIFNNSGSDIVFSAGNNLQVFQGTNGAACSAIAGTNTTSGTLVAGEVWVIGTSDLTSYSTTNGTGISGVTVFNFGFNGDDALQVYLGGVLQDVFGTCGTDPGSSWSGSGVSTANNNLQTNNGVCTGTTSNWSDPSLRFNTVAVGTDMTGFGNPPASCVTSCTAPTTQPNTISFSSVTSTSMQISWTDAGDGDGQIVLVHEGSAVNSNPSSGTAYTADSDWTGTPEQIGTGNYVVYTGDGGPVTLTNLNPNTDYYVAIYEYNTVDDCYLTTGALTGNTTTLCDDPTTQPTSVSFSSVTSTTMDISWAGGNGTNSLVVIREGSAVAGTPNDGTSYTANTAFGSGNQIAAGEYVVYNGTGATVSVTGLTPEATYYVSVFEFNSSSACYNTTSPATNNQTMPCPSPPDNVTGFAVTPGNQSATISWTNPTYCFDELLIVAEDGTIGFTPSGNGSGYIANSVYGSGTCVNCTGANTEYAVYKGSGTGVTVTGLTNGVSYCFKVWTRNGTDWSAQDVVCSIVPTAAIPDNGCGSSNDVELTFVYSGTNPIADINVDVFIEHTWRSDLQIEIESPTGTIVQVMDGTIGGSADNLEVTFDDEAAGTVSTTNHTLDGTVDEVVQSNADPLSTFDGETPTGTWIIRVCDDAGGDTGTLNSWSITIVESCTPTHTVTGFAPTTGPEGTAVTVTGTGFTTSTTAEVDGIAATVQYVSATTIIVEIPTGATDNSIDITEGGCEVSTASNFTLISTAGLCGGSTSFTDLIISEVYDSDANNVWYIELFNPTASDIDLGAENYTIERYATAGDASPTRTISLTGTVPAGGVFLINIGTSANTCTETWDFTDGGAGINENDGIMLVHNGTDVDWVECPNNTGYSILRDVAASGPTTTWNASDWTTNNTESCADLGTFGVVYDTHPSITDEPDDTHACEILKGITATAGSGGGALTYQWYYNDGSAAGWSTVTAGAFPLATVAGETSANLSITGNASDIETYDGYQFYCVCTEDGSCSTASDAAQFRARSEDDPEMITAMINSCDGVCGSEGYNEFFALEIGNVAVDVTNAANLNVSYGTSYPASTTYADGFTADAALTAAFNTDAGCALFQDAVTVGTIPANSTVLLMSENVCANAYDFSSLCGSGPIYLLYSTDASWGSTGNFANTGAGSRYFSTEITDVNGLTTTTDYDYAPNSLSGSDGDYAEFEFCAAPAYNYGNDGCSVKAVTLPVEMIFFEAYKKDRQVNLVWETASEINNDKFKIMRSFDGENFSEIGEVKGQGNSTSISYYSFIDEAPQIGDNFYAIYQYDYDGSLEKSEIRFVEFDNDFTFSGFSNGSEIILEFNDILPNSNVEIYTLEGKLVDSFVLTEKSGVIDLDLTTQSYYLIRLSNQLESKVIRVMH